MARVVLRDGRVIETCDKIMDDVAALERSQRIVYFYEHLHYLDSIEFKPLIADELQSDEFKAYSKHFDNICEDVNSKYRAPRKLNSKSIQPLLRCVVSDLTTRVRCESESKWPREFKDGVRRAAGLRKGCYPPNFAKWAIERRNAWFAGFNKEYSERACDA